MNAPQDRSQDSPDWQLRAELRAADPARNLPPATEEWLASVRRTAQQTSQARRRFRRNGKAQVARASSKRPRILVSAATAAGLFGVAVAVGLPATQSATVLSGPPSDGGGAAICAPVDAVGLRQADTAFGATVVSLDQGTASLEVKQRHRGTISTKVRVPYAPDQPLELSVGPLSVGQMVLIASLDDTVRTCGQSGPATPELTTLYQQAFG